MYPLVSVVIPCFNTEKYIAECLESLKNQTYKNLEIICVDDGSDDSTINIIKNECEMDLRIKLFFQSHKYAGAARNLGLAYANGKYIIFLDSDDYFDEITGEITTPHFLLNKENVSKYPVFSKNEFPNSIVGTTCYGPWTKLYRKEFLDEIGIQYMCTQRNNDIYFTYIAMIMARRIGAVNERLIYYRTNNSESLQGSMHKESFSTDFYEAFFSIREKLKEIDLYEKCKTEYVNRLVAQCFGVLIKIKDINIFEEAYMFIKECVFMELDVYNSYDMLTYWNLMHVKQVENMDCKEYLFNLYVNGNSDSNSDIEVSPDLLKGSTRIAIYGAGQIGKATYIRYRKKEEFVITGWYDSNYDNLVSKGIKLTSLEEMNPKDFDKIIIAVVDSSAVIEIKQTLTAKGVSENQIISNYL